MKKRLRKTFTVKKEIYSKVKKMNSNQLNQILINHYEKENNLELVLEETARIKTLIEKKLKTDEEIINLMNLFMLSIENEKDKEE